MNICRKFSTQLYVKLHLLLLRRAGLVLFLVGMGLLLAGTDSLTLANSTGTGTTSSSSGSGTSSTISVTINTTQIGIAACRILCMIEGNFGALLMVVAGLGTIMAAALGSFKTASSLLVVACASFILSSLAHMWFNFGACQCSTS